MKSKSELVKKLLEHKEQESILESHKTKQYNKLLENQAKENFDKVNNVNLSRVQKTKALSQFKESVKNALVTEAICSVFIPALEGMAPTDSHLTLARNLVSNYVKENTASKILQKFDTSRSILLSEWYRIINSNYENIITEAQAACDDNEELTIDNDNKDNFFTDLDLSKPDDLINTIRNRVSDSVQEFINSNVEDKVDIKDLLNTIQDRVASATSQEVKESYEYRAKAAVKELTNRPKGIMHHMVTSLAKKSMLDESVGKYYKNENGLLNFDSITENCEIMITFLETLNTTEIERVDGEYIKKIINNL